MRGLSTWVAWVIIALELSGVLVCYSYIVPPLPPVRYVKGFGDDNRPSVGPSYGFVLVASTSPDDDLSLGASQLCDVVVEGLGPSCRGSVTRGEESRGPSVIEYVKFMCLGWSMGVLMHYASFSMVMSLLIVVYSGSRMGYFFCNGRKLCNDIRCGLDLPIDGPLLLSDASVATNAIMRQVSS